MSMRKVINCRLANIGKFNRLFLLIFMACFAVASRGQVKTIAIVKDNKAPFLLQLEQELKQEIKNVLMARKGVDFVSVSGANDSILISKKFADIYANDKIDLVIALGIKSSRILHKSTTYPIPSIATMVFEEQSPRTSHTSNYTYTVPYKSFNKVIDYFSKMYELKNIGVLSDGLFEPTNKVKAAPTNSVKVLRITDSAIDENIDGIILLPALYHSQGEVQLFIEKANKQGIPTLAIKKDYLNFDCTAALDDKAILVPLIKQTALNCMYIFEGVNASELEIMQDTTVFSLILNMHGIRAIQKLPEWHYLENAMLVNVEKSYNSVKLELTDAILLGLQEKLSLKKASLVIQKSEQDVKQAKGIITPDLSFGTDAIWLSDNIVEASLGQKGDLTITGNLSLQQVLFSESAIANISIKKIIKESTTEQNRKEILDAVLAVSHSYISVLLAKANLTLQNENLNKTKANLSIAESKEAIGNSKHSDVSRWVSELNINKIQISAAHANYKKSQYALNEILSQPMATKYDLPNSIDIKEVFHFQEALLSPYIKNEFLIEKLADFYLLEMQSYAPELSQMYLSEQIIERTLQSNKRQFYLPEVVAFAGASDMLLQNGLVSNPQMAIPPPPQDLTWNAGVGLRFPVFDNRTRKTNLAKTKLDRRIAQYSRQELTNRLEKSIRSQLQQFKASFLSYHYAQKASVASNKNYEQAESAYKEGFITVTELLEAQVAKFNANLLLVQTNYQMVLDYLLLERLTGKIQLLDTEKEQQEYLVRLQKYLVELN